MENKLNEWRIYLRMNGRNRLWEDEKLICVLEQEFDLKKRVWTAEELKKARNALFAFPDVKAFLSETGWSRDNPECSSEEYLTTERICRWIDGRFIYFSRLLWEAGCP